MWKLISFLICHVVSRAHMIKREPHNLSHYCTKSDAYTRCINVILPHDITWSHDQRDIWLLQLEALTSSDQPTKFTTCRSCEGRDKTVFYLLCNLKKGNIVLEVCQTIPLIKNYFWKSIKDRMTSFYIFCHCKLFRDNKPL